MKKIKPGDRVRLLKWTRKEQVDNKYKGFTEKWSKEIYTVLKMNRIQKNPGFHNYYLNGLTKPRYRHELLLIPPEIDRVIPQIRQLKRPKVYESAKKDTSLYRPEDDL